MHLLEIHSYSVLKSFEMDFQNFFWWIFKCDYYPNIAHLSPCKRGVKILFKSTGLLNFLERKFINFVTCF